MNHCFMESSVIEFDVPAFRATRGNSTQGGA